MNAFIYVIRAQWVVLDYELARLYEVETAHLKCQVRHNMKRIEGEDFMFEVTREELLRYQIGNLKTVRGQCGKNESLRYLVEMPIAATYLELIQLLTF